MAASPAGRKVAGAGFAFVGLIVWVVAAVGSTAAHPEVASLGVILGGVLVTVGLALCFVPARHIGAPYFEETEEVARAPRRTRRNAELSPTRQSSGKARSALV